MTSKPSRKKNPQFNMRDPVVIVVTVREKKVRLRSMEQLKRVGNPSNEKW